MSGEDLIGAVETGLVDEYSDIQAKSERAAGMIGAYSSQSRSSDAPMV